MIAPRCIIIAKLEEIAAECEHFADLTRDWSLSVCGSANLLQSNNNNPKIAACGGVRQITLIYMAPEQKRFEINFWARWGVCKIDPWNGLVSEIAGSNTLVAGTSIIRTRIYGLENVNTKLFDELFQLTFQEPSAANEEIKDED